jgi:sulfur carrier protein ThiS
MKGMAPLHTHDNSGVIHVESTVNRDYTLGEFLKIWGIDLNGKSVKVSVNGQPVSDWRNHISSDGEQINLEIGG